MRKCFLVILLITLLPAFSFAEVSGSTVDPSEIGVGARPLGIGKAYVGMSDDASGIFMNPAGLAGIDKMKLTSMTGQVIQDINYNVIGGAIPTEWGTLGIGYINVALPSIPVTTVTGSGASATIETVGSTSYYASVTTLSFSNKLSKIDYFRDHENITYGLNFKYFTQGFDGGGSALQSATGTGFDMDLGLQYKPRKELTVGLMAMNILPESMGGRFTWVKGNTTENIPALIKLGFTAKLLGKDSYYGGNQNVFLGCDMDISPNLPRPAVYHTGVEWWPISIMALRFGVDQKPKGEDDGISVDNNLTAGLGLKHAGFTFDYCYHQYSDLTENTTHYFSIGYVGVEDAVKKGANKMPIPVIVASKKLETFSDVSQDYWARGPIELMATMGIMNGFHDGKFRPDDTVSRSEFAYMLIKLKEIDVNDVTNAPFSDVPTTYWGAKYIKAVSYLNLMGPYPDGEFKPDRKMSRVEGVVILSRMTDAKEPALNKNDPFIDVNKTHWAASYISAAKNYGLIDYLAGKEFEPNKDLTRAEVAEMLSKTSFGRDRIKKYLQYSMAM